MFKKWWMLQLSLFCLTTVSFGQRIGDGNSASLKTLIQRAQQGDPRAQFELGSEYENGKLISPNSLNKAIQWYRKAAEQGNPQAQFALGSIYEFGRGGKVISIEPNKSEAVQWYRKAAEQGDVKAQIKCGDIYAEGNLIPKDPVTAFGWYSKAAAQNDGEAFYKLGAGYEYGLVGPVDDGEAIRWYRRAAERGNRAASDTLASRYLEGRGVKKDYVEAARLYGCAKPSAASLNSYNEITYEALPRGARDLLLKMKCDVARKVLHGSSNYDYGSTVDLDDKATPAYEVCCSEAAHGPCQAAIIGKIGKEWRELSPESGLDGFEPAMAGLIVLDSQQNGFHDICLPNRCSSPKCDSPLIWQFSNDRYHSVNTTP